MPKKSWKPVLAGKTYCSSMCGRGCTKAEHDKAMSRAEAIAKRLRKSHPNLKWVVRVWENLGWHYEVAIWLQDGRLDVRQFVGRRRSFLATLELPTSRVCFTYIDTVPGAAVQAVFTQAADYYKRIGTTLKRLGVVKAPPK